MAGHRAGPLPPDEAAQAEVLAFLSRPEAAGRGTVTRIDTHVSHVFLSGDRALKLKRALRTNFLDQSSPELRRRAAEREVALNRRTAPELYLGVVPVTREEAGLALGGPGPAVDWLVEMRAFDRAQEFDRLADAGRLTAEDAEALADVIAAFHARAERVRSRGGAEAVAGTIRQIAGAVSAAHPALAIAALDWAEAAERAVAPRAARLAARGRHGFVRRCHGDLHLANIVRIDGRPVPYDALEFSEAMATTDVLYDLAFPVMDLIARWAQPLAVRLVNRALARSRDWSGAGLLPLFASMRAAVRVIAAPEPGGGEAEARLALAFSLLADPPPPRLICVGGLSGTGKTTLAESLAPLLGGPLGARVMRADVLRKVLAGVEPEEPLPAAAYTAGSTARVQRALLRDAGRALRAGSVVILDTTFLDPAFRARAEGLARAAGTGFAGLWLTGSLGALAERIAGRGRDASDADAEVLARQAAGAAGVPERWREIATGAGAEAVLAAARAALG